MYKDTHVNMGSAKPEKPVSRRTDGPASAGPGPWNPAAAAKHLKGQDTCIPGNSGPMKSVSGSKSIA